MAAILSSVLTNFVADVAGAAPALVVLAAAFTALGLAAPGCNPGGPWWRKRGLATDLAYAAAVPTFARYGNLLLMTIGLVLFCRVDETTDVAGYLAHGHGPIARLPFWAQAALYLLVSDLVMYWSHRIFHGRGLWRFHAAHHSSEDVEWVSATRFHPVDLTFHSVLSDVVPLLLGLPPDVIIWMMPFNVGTSALVHANLNWTFGPLRYVLVSPVFHRWHHTSPRQGGNSNFAGTFSFYDLIFGTFHMPRGALPERYGFPHIAPDFGGQMMHPFRRTPKPDRAPNQG